MKLQTLIYILIACFLIIAACLAIMSYINQLEEREEYLDSIERTEGKEKRLQREYELKQEDRLRNTISMHNNYHHYRH